MINSMCMMDDDYGKLWHYIDFPCCVPSFFPSIMLQCFWSKEHKPSLRSTKHRLHQCSSDSSDPEERYKPTAQLASKYAFPSPALLFSMRTAYCDSCFLFSFSFVFNNRFFGSNQVE